MQGTKNSASEESLQVQFTQTTRPGVFLGGDTTGSLQSVFHYPVSFSVGFNVGEQNDQLAIGVYQLPEFRDAENKGATSCDVTVA